MEWMVFAVASSFTFALVSVLDKLLISDYVANSKVFVATVGIAQILLGLFALPFALDSPYPITAVLIALLSGVFSGAYLVAMFIIMESQDVSRVVPVVSTYPVFVALLAYLFLGESVTPFAWICVIVTVAGAALVSLAPSSRGSQGGRESMVAMAVLFIASMSFGLSQFLSKTIADDMTLWGQFMLRGMGGGIVCGCVILSTSVRDGLFEVLRKPKNLSLIALTEVFLVFFAILFFFKAIYSGEVYLTATVMATRPLFVFALTLFLSIPFIGLFKESMEGTALMTRATGIVLTVSGVIGVSLL